MSMLQQLWLILHTAAVAIILPVSLLLVNRLLIRYLDDRGMYRVPPFSWLPLLAGSALCSAALNALDIVGRLNPSQLWLSDFWALRFDELYDVWLRPSDVLLAVIAGLIEFYNELLYEGWSVWLFQGSAVVAGVVALLAWRSWQAIRGILLFFWLSLAVMILMYISVILLAWVIHWLNFWALVVLFLFLYMYDKEGDQQHGSPL